MDGIVMSLMTAHTQHLLINIYQVDAEDFYTGYVQAVADDGVVLRTYNDAGLPDGAAFIALAAIDSVEVSGNDLDTMAYRIQKATDLKFKSAPAAPLALPLNPEAPLLYQVAENMRRTGQAVMIVATDAESYLEGQILEVTQTNLTLEAFNKFNFTDTRTVQVDFTALNVLEYEGYDLFLETALLMHRDGMNHVPTARYRNFGEIDDLLDIAAGAEQLIAVSSRLSVDNFFVGRVRTVTGDWAAMSLVDMSGQFGGYALIRLSSIHSVIIESDYLQTVAEYERWGEAHNFVQIPNLNRDREFADDEDLLSSLIGEGEIFGRVFRVRTASNEEPVTGMPIAVNDGDFTMVPTGMTPDDGVVFRNEQVQDMSFGSVYAYLQELWFKEQE